MELGHRARECPNTRKLKCKACGDSRNTEESCFVKKFGRTTPKPEVKCGWEKCGRMGHSEDDCYLRKIQAEREEKKRRAPIDRGLRESGKIGNSPLQINSIPINAICRKLPIVRIFFKNNMWRH